MPEKLPEIILGELLRRSGLRLATAESCTGGLAGHRITNVPGSSTYFIGGVIAYAYEAKVRLLGSLRLDLLAVPGEAVGPGVFEIRGAEADPGEADRLLGSAAAGAGDAADR